MFCSSAVMFMFISSPPDSASIEYEISSSGFSDFLRTFCDFLNNVYT